MDNHMDKIHSICDDDKIYLRMVPRDALQSREVATAAEAGRIG